MYQKFETVVKLQVNERAKGNDVEQENFRQLQMRARNGDSSLQDWEALLERNPTKVQNLTHFKNCAVRLSFGNEKVATDNYNKLCELRQPRLMSNAHHINSKAKLLSTEEMGGLEPTLHYA